MLPRCFSILFVVGFLRPAGAEKCYDLPGQMDLISTLRENTRPGEVAFQFSMNMDSVTLTLVPSPGSDGYLRLETIASLNVIYVNQTLTINSLNPDLNKPPPPDTDEEVDCGGQMDEKPALYNVVNLVQYTLVCEYPDFQPTGQDVQLFVQPEVNDFAPIFLCDPYRKQISEFTPIGSTVFSANGLAWDPDVEGEIDGFQLVGNGSGVFAMPRYRDGGIILEQRLDYEIANSYVLNITVNDYSNDLDTPRRSNWTTLTLNIIDEDDQNPAFTHRWHYLRIPEENSSIIGLSFETVPKVHAFDLDVGRNDTVHYNITAGHQINGVDYFDIDPVNGNLIPLRSIDRETISTFLLEIMAYQLNNPTKRKAFAFIEIQIEDVNDNPPVMAADVYKVLVPEHPPLGMIITTVSAFDPDEGDNAVFEYALTDPIQAFSINPATGDVSVRNSTTLDRESILAIFIYVTAKETLSAEKYESQPARIEISLSDINDNNPVFTEGIVHEFYMPTVVPGNSFLGSVAASDADLGGNGEVKYFLSSALSDAGADSEFYVDEESGHVYTAVDLQKDEGDFFNLGLMAEDTADIATDRRTSVARVRVIFTDSTTPTRTSSTTATQATLSTPRSTSPPHPCQCTTPSSGQIGLYPPEVFWPVVALLIFAVILLISIIVLLFILRRYAAPSKVDRGTEALLPAEHDTASLLSSEHHHHHLRMSINRAFRQLDEETSTEAVIRAARQTIEARESHEKPPLLQWPVHDLSPLVTEQGFASEAPSETLTQTANNVPYGRLDGGGSLLDSNLDNLSVSINVDTAEPIYTISTSKLNRVTSFPVQTSSEELLPGDENEANNAAKSETSESESEQDFSGWKSSSETSMSAEMIRDDSMPRTPREEAPALMPEITELYDEPDPDQISGVLLLDSVLEAEEMRSEPAMMAPVKREPHPLGMAQSGGCDGDAASEFSISLRSASGSDMDKQQVHVVGELPKPFKQEDEDNYVDHTFYTRVGPVTIL